MQVTRRSCMTGVTRTLEINVTQEQLDKYAEGKLLIQHVMPNITRSEREFIKTGMTDQEWEDATRLP